MTLGDTLRSAADAYDKKKREQDTILLANNTKIAEERFLLLKDNFTKSALELASKGSRYTYIYIVRVGDIKGPWIPMIQKLFTDWLNAEKLSYIYHPGDDSLSTNSYYEVEW